MWSNGSKGSGNRGSSLPGFHPGAWLLWLAAGMLASLLTRNPFYLVILLVVAAVVNWALGRQGGPDGEMLQPAFGDGATRGRALLLRVTVGVLLVVTLIKGLSTNIGATVLFRLPEISFPPGWPIITIGGPVTAEGMASAALDALSLAAVLAVFVAFSRGADYYALLRSVPAFMHQAGLVTSIAITFVPQTVTRFAEIREAQALRGHRIRRAGDLLPIVMPLLAGGMERSLDLAEAMEARGFSRGPAAEVRTVSPILVQSGLALGLGLLLAGGTAFTFLPGASWAGWLGIVAGVALTAITLWSAGRGSHRSRYRHRTWRDSDTTLAAISIAVLAILLTYKITASSSLVYDPLSRLRIYAPPFDPVLALALAALTAPALIAASRKRSGRPTK